MTRLKLWKEHSTWEEAEAAWDKKAAEVSRAHPLKRLKTLPQMPGITPETAKYLTLKSFRYMLFHREGIRILKHAMKHPFKYGLNYIFSLFRKKAYTRDEDFFYYNLKSTQEFVKIATHSDTLLVVGFSYCQKPFECPSGRFSTDCIHDATHPVCRQCDIGKVIHALPDNRVIPLMIPTVHYIGNQLFEIAHAHPQKKILFLITACEMTLEMFGDWGNMLGVKGIGVRLDGRICNTMKAFELSEEGIKPGLTVVTSKTQQRILSLIKALHVDPESSF